MGTIEPHLDELYHLRSMIVDCCERCDGAGYVLDEDGDDSTCSCMQVFRYVIRLVVANIPRDYWHLFWKELNVGKAVKKLLSRYFDNFSIAAERGLGILFLGANGVGKTALMCEIGKHALVHGRTVLYFTNDRYITALQRNDDVFLRQVEDSQVLLLDEVEKAYSRDGGTFVPKKTEALLRSSLSLGRIVVMATNYPEEDLTEMFGESTMSLLRRRLKFVPVVGQDRSVDLQDRWTETLTTTYDFMHPHIVEQAAVLHQFEME